MTRVCFFTSHFDFTRQRYLDYYEKIIPKNSEFFLLCSEGDISKFKTKKIKKHSFSCSKFFAPFSIRKFCKKNEIDIITNLSGSAEISASLSIASAFSKTKSIFYFHGNPSFRKKDVLFFLTQFFIDRFLVSAKDITEKVKVNLFFSKIKIFHLPLTINTKLFLPKNKNELRKKLKFGLNEKIILFAGRISYLKGSDLLRELIKKNPDKKFILVGQILDDNYKNFQRKNLVLVPATYNLVDYYNIADLCVSLSRIEGFGLIPREAMACGTPVMVSEIESLRLIKPAIKSKLDIEDANKKLNNFFSLPISKKNKLKKQSREFILEECSEENNQLKRKYQKLLFEI